MVRERSLFISSNGSSGLYVQFVDVLDAVSRTILIASWDQKLSRVLRTYHKPQLRYLLSDILSQLFTSFGAYNSPVGFLTEVSLDSQLRIRGPPLTEFCRPFGGNFEWEDTFELARQYRSVLITGNADSYSRGEGYVQQQRCGRSHQAAQPKEF